MTNKWVGPRSRQTCPTLGACLEAWEESFRKQLLKEAAPMGDGEFNTLVETEWEKVQRRIRTTVGEQTEGLLGKVRWDGDVRERWFVEDGVREKEPI